MEHLTAGRYAAVVTIVFVLPWLCPASGVASTVSVRTTVEPMFGDEVLYAAAPGERNEVSLHMQPDPSAPDASYLAVWTVSDPGAVIEAGESCTSLDEHTAQCRPRQRPPFGLPYTFFEGLLSAHVLLGDGDDRLLGVTSTSSFGGWVVASGGAGSDQITGSADRDDLRGDAGNDRIFAAAGEDRLDGGGGRDQLDGGADRDRLADGDRDGDSGRHPGPDLLDGGTEEDLVDYSTRRLPVFVDLADPRPDGRQGEGDVLHDVEAVYGGRGNDRLVGDDQANVLDGRGGHNQLTGGRGDDVLRSSGLPIACGAGRDIVTGDRPSTSFERMSFRLEYLRQDCERVESYADSVVLPARPAAVRGRNVAFRLRCPSTGEDSGPCSATMRLTEWAAPRRRLATGEAPKGLGGRFVRLRLSRLGHRLATRPNGVRVAARLNVKAETYGAGSHSFTVRWGIRLLTPR